MENREVLTLLPKKRSGILRLVFSRIGLVACLLAVEAFFDNGGVYLRTTEEK